MTHLNNKLTIRLNETQKQRIQNFSNKHKVEFSSHVRDNWLDIMLSVSPEDIQKLKGMANLKDVNEFVTYLKQNAKWFNTELYFEEFLKEHGKN